MGTSFVATVQYQASMLGGNVAGSAHYYCCQLSFCWLVACQSCGSLQLHWGMSSSWGESKKCFEAQDGWLFFWGAYGTRSIRPIATATATTTFVLWRHSKVWPSKSQTPHHAKGLADAATYIYLSDIYLTIINYWSTDDCCTILIYRSSNPWVKCLWHYFKIFNFHCRGSKAKRLSI